MMRRRVLLLAFVGLFTGALVARPSDTYARAGEVTCGWCMMFITFGDDTVHGFYDEDGDECGFPMPTDIPGELEHECSRCGGTSECHTLTESGPCHLACGSGNGFAALTSKLREALAARDVERLLVAMRAQESDEAAYSVVYNSRGGRIEVRGPCDGNPVVARFAVPLAIRSRLSAAE